jgi:hypothetical protein
MIRWFQRRKAELVFLVIIAAGVAAHYVNVPFSDALIIAGILGLTVDRYLKTELLRDASTIILGWGLPHQLESHIRRISQTAIVRQNFRVHYRLQVDGPDVIIDVRYEWDVYNFGPRIELYQSRIAVDKYTNPDCSKIECVAHQGGRATHWPADSLNNAERRTENRDTITWTIPAMKLWPQDHKANLPPACHVVWQYRVRMPKDYADDVSFDGAAIGMTVSAECPPELVFECDADDTTTHAPNSLMWVHDRLFVPNQVVGVRWSPKREPEPKNCDPDNGVNAK